MTDRILKGATDVHLRDLYPAPVKIDFDPFDMALPEVRMTSKRLCEYVLAQSVATEDWQLFFGFFRFAGDLPFPSDLFPRTGHRHFSETARVFYNTYLENLFVFEWQHSTPDFASLVKEGLAGKLERIRKAKEIHANDPEKLDFLDAMEECAHGIIAWAHKCASVLRERAAETSDPKRKEELLSGADILEWVPEHPARTFREGLQTIVICFSFLSDSVGTIDRILYPLYKKDLDEGRLTREQAKEYLQSLFLVLQAHTPFTGAHHTKGGECHFAIGGYLPDGSDGFSDLSRLIVEALMEMPMDIPEITLRWTKKTPREVLRFMMDCERHDSHKRIAFASDEPRIHAFMNRVGLSFEDACNYTMVGCNEPAFPGTLWMGGITVNIARSLTNLLFDHKEEVCRCKTFDEFYALYEKSLENDLDRIIEISNRFQKMRAKDKNVVSSLLMDGCIESATSATASGCRIKIGGGETMGITCVIDSLTVIKKFVFDDKTVSMEHLIATLESDWALDPDLQTRILRTAPFFGNSEEISDRMAVRFTTSLGNLSGSRRLVGGERIVFGTLAGYNPHFAKFGALTKATPDGRNAGEAFMVGTGQSSGKDREGLTALLSSVAQMDPTGVYCGPFLLNARLDEKLIREDAYFEKTVDEIEAYFRQGGMHIQLNYVSAEELLDAKSNPEKYPCMKVRVSGFSGVFVTLPEAIQDNVIARTVIGG